MKFSENVLISRILRKTALKSLNKRQCTEAFERGDWKSHNFHENPAFCSKSYFYKKVNFRAKVQKS